MKSIIDMLRVVKREFYKPLILIKLKWLMYKHIDNLKLIIGASNTKQEGWISTDYPALDLSSEKSFERLLPSQECVKNFLAEHVWEHLDYYEGMQGLENCFKYLKRGGRLRIAVPDGLHPDNDYINQVKPGGYGYGADDHKMLYDYRSLSEMMTSLGFRVTLLEWFDENGKFHYEDWDISDGMIRRSTRFDSRNFENPTNYTSLIIDAIKP